MLDALAYLKAARSMRVPAALEVSRSGVGAHAWVFFTAQVPGRGSAPSGHRPCPREAMALRGQMGTQPATIACSRPRYVVPAGGVGNLIAAALLHGLVPPGRGDRLPGSGYARTA